MVGIPGNLADVAAKIKDGQLGLIEVVSLGGVAVSALTGLSGEDSLDAVDRPVQAGFTMIHAVAFRPVTRTWDVILANPSFGIEAGIDAALTGNFAGFSETWHDKRKKLKSMFSGVELVTAVGVDESLENCIITALRPRYDVENNYDAWIAQIDLLQIDIRQLGSATDSKEAMTSTKQYVGAL